MEALQVLEKKIAGLVTLVQQLKLENSALTGEIAQLKQKLETQENVLFSDYERLEKLDKETATTKQTIGDLIQRIDSFIECEDQQ